MGSLSCTVIHNRMLCAVQQRSGVGVTQQISSVSILFPIPRIIKARVTCWISHSYLTGVCNHIRPIWMWLKWDSRHIYKIRNFLNREFISSPDSNIQICWYFIHPEHPSSGISLFMCPANERSRYIVTTSLPSGHTPVQKTSSRHVFKTYKTLTQMTSIRPKIRRLGD